MERPKRALGQMGGRVRRQGDPALSHVLARAWDRAGRDDPDVLTHGFHSWPARMHRALARTVIEAFDARTVLDPFCGGGTVLIEARVASRRSVGVDLNPLAEMVARVKTRAPMLDERKRFLARAEAVAAASEERVRGRVPIRVDLPTTETRWYGPHVLKELGGLLEEIRAIDDRPDRVALACVFSSNLIKVSKQRSDTEAVEETKRIRKGLTTELFLSKAKELERRWAEFAEVAKGPPSKLYKGDIRRLPRLAKNRQVDLILTSPPYGGTYDYADHHARRIAFLGLDDRPLRRLEIGSRRRMGRSDAMGVWDDEIREMLRAMRPVLQQDAHIVLVMGDAKIGARHISAPRQLERIAPELGFKVSACASQARRHPREEHLIALKPE